MKQIFICGEYILLVCCVQFTLQGQNLVSITPPSAHVEQQLGDHQKKMKSLKSLLSDLEQEYKVSFFYKTELVENIYVEERRPQSRSGSLEEILITYLKPLKLTFEQVSFT